MVIETEQNQPSRPKVSRDGSIELVVVGLLAALVVVLAAPLFLPLDEVSSPKSIEGSATE